MELYHLKRNGWKVEVHYVNQTEPQSKRYILLLEREGAVEEERALLGRGTARWGEQDKRIKGQRVNNVEIHNILEPYVIKKSTILFMSIQ